MTGWTSSTTCTPSAASLKEGDRRLRGDNDRYPPAPGNGVGEETEFPVVAVNDTPMKRFFDNVHGTGESVLSSIMITTNTLIAGKYFVIAGYGYCGRGLAQKAHGLGAKVVVTEIDPRRALEAHMDGYHVMTMDQAADIGDIFVTTTGNTSVIGKNHFGKLKPGAILANAGDFNVEIDIAWLAKHADSTVERDGIVTYILKGKPVHALAEGRLVNLATPKGMGHPIEVMDLSSPCRRFAPGILRSMATPSKAVSTKCPRRSMKWLPGSNLHRLAFQIDELSAAQKKYSADWDMGRKSRPARTFSLVF